jgi:peroxiredoxin
MSLQATLDAFKADFRSGKPPYNTSPEIHPIMDRATAELVASGQANRAAKACDKAHTFTLRDGHGHWVSSLELLAKGPLVVSFYRGVWCPYCNFELQALEAALPMIREAGANLVAISPQLAASSQKSTRIHHLSFPILSDPNNQVAASFGLRYALPNYLVDLYKSRKIDLPAINGDDSWTLPMPARYVIAPDRTIVYAEVNPDYTQRPEPEDLLPILKQYGNH